MFEKRLLEACSKNLYYLDVFFLKKFIQYSIIDENIYSKQEGTAEQEDYKGTKNQNKNY